MNCNDIDLVSYLKDELTDEHKKQVEEHLKTCPACQRDFDETKQILSALKEWTAPEVGNGFVIRVKEALFERYPRFGKKPGLWERIFGPQPVKFPAWTLSAAIHVVIIAVLVIVFYNSYVIIVKPARPVVLPPSEVEPYILISYAVHPEDKTINEIPQKQHIKNRVHEDFRDRMRQIYDSEDTKISVENALNYLAGTQGDSGCWEIKNKRARLYVSSFCLLSFIVEGNTHLSGKYKGVVKKGITFITTSQQPDGWIVCGEKSPASHIVATIVLLEDYLATGDHVLYPTLKSAIAHLSLSLLGLPLKNRLSFDDSRNIICWLVFALKLAKEAGFDVEYRYKNALDEMQKISMDLPVYIAFSLFNSSVSGLYKKRSVNLDLERYKEPANPYAIINFSLALFQTDKTLWQKYNTHIKTIILKLQKNDGSFQPFDGDKIYSTALYTLFLQTCYRYRCR
jgi:hypothetical protein